MEGNTSKLAPDRTLEVDTVFHRADHSEKFVLDVNDVPDVYSAFECHRKHPLIALDPPFDDGVFDDVASEIIPFGEGLNSAFS